MISLDLKFWVQIVVLCKLLCCFWILLLHFSLCLLNYRFTACLQIEFMPLTSVVMKQLVFLLITKLEIYGSSFYPLAMYFHLVAKYVLPRIFIFCHVKFWNKRSSFSPVCLCMHMFMCFFFSLYFGP